MAEREYAHENLVDSAMIVVSRRSASADTFNEVPLRAS